MTLIKVKVSNPKIKVKVYNGIGSAPFKEHIVTINIDSIVKENEDAPNFFDITWASSAPYQDWIGTMAQAHPGLEVLVLMPNDFTAGDRCRTEYSDALTTVQLSGIPFGWGDPGQINGRTFLIRYPA